METRDDRLIVTRTLTKAECHWLDEPIPEGTIVYPFTGYTYGCISPTGVAVCLRPETTAPFTEVPADALRSRKDT